MDRIEFEKNIGLYGADITTWPAVLQSEVNRTLATHPEFAQMLEEEKNFEQRILARTVLDANDTYFSERIIAIARSRAPQLTWQMKIQLMIEEILSLTPFPKPAYALAGIALAGLISGTLLDQASSITSDTNDNFLYEEDGII